MEIAIAEARVLINGVPAKIGARVFPEDELRLDGEVVARQPRRRRTLLYYKPRGEVVTRADGEGAPTIFERLPAPGSGRWINVGRLDLDSEGLILVTTDGEWAERLSHPRNGFEREYLARVYGELSDDAIAQVCAGVEVDGKPLTPLAFERRAVGGSGRNRWYRVVLGEGRNRAVRRLFAALGCEVSRLLRVRFGPYVLPRDLRPGEWREAPPLPDFGESDNAQAGWETRGQRDFHSRPPRDFRDRDSRDSRSFRDNRDFRDRDSRPFRNNRDFRDRDSRDSRPFRDNRDFRDRDSRDSRPFRDNRNFRDRDSRPPRDFRDRDSRPPRNFRDDRGDRFPRDRNFRDRDSRPPFRPRFSRDDRGDRDERGERGGRDRRDFRDNRGGFRKGGNFRPRNFRNDRPSGNFRDDRDGRNFRDNRENRNGWQDRPPRDFRDGPPRNDDWRPRDRDNHDDRPPRKFRKPPR